MDLHRTIQSWTFTLTSESHFPASSFRIYYAELQLGANIWLTY